MGLGGGGKGETSKNKRILLPAMHTLLPNYTNLKTLGKFENLVFLIMSTREIYVFSLELLTTDLNSFKMSPVNFKTVAVFLRVKIKISVTLSPYSHYFWLLICRQI